MEYKGFKIVSDGTMGHYNVMCDGRGSVPLSLRGMYTNQSFAKKAIDAHLSTKKKGNTNGKADNSE